jgi:hypothetical protein
MAMNHIMAHIGSAAGHTADFCRGLRHDASLHAGHVFAAVVPNTESESATAT